MILNKKIISLLIIFFWCTSIIWNQSTSMFLKQNYFVLFSHNNTQQPVFNTTILILRAKKNFSCYDARIQCRLVLQFFIIRKFSLSKGSFICDTCKNTDLSYKYLRRYPNIPHINSTSIDVFIQKQHAQLYDNSIFWHEL